MNVTSLKIIRLVITIASKMPKRTVPYVNVESKVIKEVLPNGSHFVKYLKLIIKSNQYSTMLEWTEQLLNSKPSPLNFLFQNGLFDIDLNTSVSSYQQHKLSYGNAT